MIQVTDEMIAAYDDAAWDNPVEFHGLAMADIRSGLAAVLAIIERDNYVSRRPTPEEIAAWPKPRRRLRACVEQWPEAYTCGYDPRCCRFPKSCSATVYDDDQVTADDLEPSHD